jgi:hypothetical protein
MAARSLALIIYAFGLGEQTLRNLECGASCSKYFNIDKMCRIRSHGYSSSYLDFRKPFYHRQKGKTYMSSVAFEIILLKY